LLIVGSGALAGSQAWYGARIAPNQRPLIVAPIDGSGARATSRFTIPSEGRYVIGLELQRRLPFEKLDAMLDPRTSPLRLRWWLRRGDEVVEAGALGSRRQGFETTKTMGQELYQLVGNGGESYELEVQSEAVPAELDQCNPQVTVSRHPGAWVVPMLVLQLVGCGGLLAILIAVWCFGAAAFDKRRAKFLSEVAND